MFKNNNKIYYAVKLCVPIYTFLNLLPVVFNGKNEVKKNPVVF